MICFANHCETIVAATLSKLCTYDNPRTEMILDALFTLTYSLDPLFTVGHLNTEGPQIVNFRQKWITMLWNVISLLEDPISCMSPYKHMLYIQYFEVYFRIAIGAPTARWQQQVSISSFAYLPRSFNILVRRSVIGMYHLIQSVSSTPPNVHKQGFIVTSVA